MLLFLGISTVFLYILSVPLRVKVKGGVDFDDGQGGLSATLFGITVFRLEGEFDKSDGGLLIFNRKKKRDYKFKPNQKGAVGFMRMMKNFDYALIGNLNIRRISLRIRYGHAGGDAFKSVMYMGAARMVFYSAISVLKSKQYVEVAEDIVPVFGQKTFAVELYGIFSLSLADIIYGFCAIKIRKFKRRIWQKFKQKRKAAV